MSGVLNDEAAEHDRTASGERSTEAGYGRLIAYLEACESQLDVAIKGATRDLDGLTEATLNGGTPGDIVTRLQFVDRFVQQLGNARGNLARLIGFIKHSGREGALDGGWSQLIDEARASLTMEGERRLFDEALGRGRVPGRQAGQAAELFSTGEANER